MIAFLKWLAFSIFIVSVLFVSPYFQDWLYNFSNSVGDANVYFFSAMPEYIKVVFIGFVIVILITFVAWLIF